VTASVIGGVYGAHRALVDELGDDAPTYEWCETQWAGLRRSEPADDRLLPAWLVDQLHARLPLAEPALDPGQAS